MPACPAQNFANITPDQFAALQKKAKASGILMDSNSGIASSFGGSFEWNYDPATLAFTITIIKPPMMMNCESAIARISAMVRGVVA
jgi:hypothetical protein